MRKCKVLKIISCTVIMVLLLGTISAFAVEPRWTHISSYSGRAYGSNERFSNHFYSGHNFTINHSQSCFKGSIPISAGSLKVRVYKQQGDSFKVVKSTTVTGNVSGKKIACSTGSGNYYFGFLPTFVDAVYYAEYSGSAMY